MGLTGYLQEYYGVPQATARKAAERFEQRPLQRQLSRLERTIGKSLTIESVAKGLLLDLSPQELDCYLRDVETSVRQYTLEFFQAKDFYSPKKLKSALRRVKVQSLKITNETVPINGFRILNPHDQQARQYLDSLITNGEVSVDPYDHWTTNGRSKGLRGRDILRNLKRDLTLVYNQLGFPQPKVIIDWSNHIVSIGELEKTTLAAIRRAAYGQP